MLCIVHCMFAHLHSVTSAWVLTQMDVCTIWPQLARPLSACCKAVVEHMHGMDIELRHRFADWLALHVANTNFTWPWHRWSYIMDGPKWSPRRCAALTA